MVPNVFYAEILLTGFPSNALNKAYFLKLLPTSENMFCMGFCP